MVLHAPNWVGQTVVGRYAISRHLGEGGMADVFMASDERTGRTVIIKIPKPALLADAEFSKRFDREIRAMAELSHPHIVPIMDRGTHGGFPFYVMEPKTGGSLEDRFQARKPAAKAPLPHASLAEWLMPIAKALDYIHSRGYVHRDVKPSNILFDEQGTACLSDFGIVKIIATRDEANTKATVMTQAGMVIGTPQYIAPEIFLALAYDGRADQYSLAATVYETLSCRLPYEGTNMAAIVLKQSKGKFPPLRTYAPHVPPQLERAIERALQNEPGSRFSSCREFAQEALSAIGDEKSARLSGKSSANLSSPNQKATPDRGRKTPPPLPPELPPALPESFSSSGRSPSSGERKRKTTPPPLPDMARPPARKPTTSLANLVRQIKEFARSRPAIAWSVVGIVGVVLIALLIYVAQNLGRPSGFKTQAIQELEAGKK